MTLLVRDEVATDHRSVDGTTDVLRSYERDGRLHLIREERKEFRGLEYVTRLARLAATDVGADWVINVDADEFWRPREPSLYVTLEAVPSRFGLVVGFWRHFVTRPDDGRPFHERMLVRWWPSRDGTSQHAGIKVAHRADPDVLVAGASHKAFGRGLVPLREWVPIAVLHFPIRARADGAEVPGLRRRPAGAPLGEGKGRD